MNFPDGHLSLECGIDGLYSKYILQWIHKGSTRIEQNQNRIE